MPAWAAVLLAIFTPATLLGVAWGVKALIDWVFGKEPG